MKIISTYFFITLALHLNQCETLHIVKDEPYKDGTCNARCLIPDQVERHYEEYIAYTGNELEEDVDVVVKKIQTKPATSKWIKKKADKNCLSDDPDDCLVWCLVEIPEQYRNYKILLDTMQSKNFEIRSIEYEEIIKPGGYTEWRAVLCEDQVTTSRVIQIQEALEYEGLYQEEIHGNMDKYTREALVAFQKENNLPVGQLDYETLDVLGVDY